MRVEHLSWRHRTGYLLHVCLSVPVPGQVLIQVMAQVHVLCPFPRIKVYCGVGVCGTSDRSQEVRLQESSASVQLTTWTVFHLLSSVFSSP